MSSALPDSTKTFSLPLLIIGAGVVLFVIVLLVQSGGEAQNADSQTTAYAAQANLDSTAFNACLSKREAAAEALADYDYGVAHGIDSTPTIFINGIKISGAQPFEVFAAVIDQELAGTTPDTVQRAEISVDDDPVMGTFSAPVTIVEFSDFDCPYCKRHALETVPKIKEQYIDTGKAKYVFRDFPITNLHPNALHLAAASNCAHEQGKYWEMHDILFEQQDTRK